MEADLDTLKFFEGHPGALPLFCAFEAMLLDAFPEVHRRVQKTQITLFNRHVFACVSFARVKRKACLPAEWITVTLGLPAPLLSERAAVQTEPYPGRWTTHIVVSRPEDLDAELLSWVREAYAFAAAK